MQNRLCEMFGIEFPIFAFTHCRDVAAAVSRAGGMGVLGALAFSPDQLELELQWIDEHVDGKPYGVDVVIPVKSADREMGLSDEKSLADTLHGMITEEHWDFVHNILAQGYEAGGHTGEVASMVLIPDVVDAIAPTPVLAAGGVGSGRQMAAAMALGADGVWTGSVWLTVAESDMQPPIMEKLLAASSTDTVRSRSMTGKPARQLRTAWTEAWESPDAPKPLPMPLQFILWSYAMRRITAAGNRELLGMPVGQIVSRMNKVRTAKEIIFEMIEEYIDVTERLNRELADVS